MKFDAAQQAEAFLKDHPSTQARFDQVAKLIDGLETPFGLELLATVHWIARQERVTDVSDVVAKVYDWNDRKRMFKEQQIQLAWELLHQKRWLSNDSDLIYPGLTLQPLQPHS